MHLKAHSHNLWKQQQGEENACKNIGMFNLDEDSKT